MSASRDASAKQDFPQNDRIVVSLVMRRKYECNPASLGESTQFAEPVVMPMYLFRVAAAKLAPTGRIMSEPLSQRGAGCKIPGPQIDCGIRFPDPAGPQAIDQYASAVARTGGIVCPL